MEPSSTNFCYKLSLKIEGKSRTYGDTEYTKVEILGKGYKRICWKAQFGKTTKAVVKEVFRAQYMPEVRHYLLVIETINGHPAIVNTETTFWTNHRKDAQCYKFFQIQTAYENNLVIGINSGIFYNRSDLIQLAFEQLANGLSFIHSKGVVINDLKLDNIFYLRNPLRLVYGDFEGADLKNQKSSIVRLTDNYAAPSRREDGIRTCEDDVFSLGICFAYIQQPLEKQLKFPYLIAKQLQIEYGEAVDKFASKLVETSWTPLIKQMLAYIRSERPTADEIRTKVTREYAI